jgi:tripartite-type tricarboxylate transporter receptor subunit TctC
LVASSDGKAGRRGSIVAANDRRKTAALAASSLLLSFLATPIPPANAADAYFKDKQIRLVVGSAAGGGYDAYGRLLAQYMRNHIPGNPTIIVQNMPGAGSLVAANYIYNVAPKDGTFFGAVNAMLATDPLVYPERVKFDPRRFGWLGSALRENHIGVAWSEARVRSLDDVLKNQLIVAGTGGATNFYPLFVDALLGAKMKMIPGYQGTKQGMLAMERGEAGGVVGITWASVKATNGSWLRDDKIRVFAQFGLKKHPELPDVSWIYDYAHTDDDRAAMDLAFGNSEFGRPFMAPPGVPDRVVEILRDAFEDTMSDPAFQADAEKRELDLSFTSGREIQSLIEKIYQTPPAVVARVRQIVQSAE